MRGGRGEGFLPRKNFFWPIACRGTFFGVQPFLGIVGY